MNKIYELRKVDGTSWTGTSELVGFYLKLENAEAAAAEIDKPGSWYSARITERVVMD